MSEQEDKTQMDNVTLKEFLCAKINALEERIELNLRLNQTALDKAELKMDERLNRMNEFRDALKDQASKFVTKSEIDLMLSSIKDDIRILREYKIALESKASATSVFVAYVLSFIAIIIGIVGILNK